MRSWGQQGLDAPSPPPDLQCQLRLAPKILVLQETGVNDGSGEDSEGTSPGAPFFLPVDQFRQAVLTC